MKKGCGRKIEKYQKGCNWKLCSTCLLEVRRTGTPAQLIDGTTWNLHRALSCLGQMRRAGVKGIPESKSSLARQEKHALRLKRVAESDPKSESSGDEQDDEGELDTIGPRQVRFATGTEALIKKLRYSKARKSGKRPRTGNGD